jgi:hypothetical protein
LRKHQGGSRSGLSGINRPVKNLNRNPRQPNQLLSQQNRPTTDISVYPCLRGKQEIADDL